MACEGKLSLMECYEALQMLSSGKSSGISLDISQHFPGHNEPGQAKFLLLSQHWFLPRRPQNLPVETGRGESLSSVAMPPSSWLASANSLARLTANSFLSFVVHWSYVCWACYMSCWMWQCWSQRGFESIDTVTGRKKQNKSKLLFIKPEPVMEKNSTWSKGFDILLSSKEN